MCAELRVQRKGELNDRQEIFHAANVIHVELNNVYFLIVDGRDLDPFENNLKTKI